MAFTQTVNVLKESRIAKLINEPANVDFLCTPIIGTQELVNHLVFGKKMKPRSLTITSNDHYGRLFLDDIASLDRGFKLSALFISLS